MAIINQSKPTTSIIDSTRPQKGETWASITSSWQNELHIWAALASLLTNNNRQTSNITNSNRPI